MDGGIREEAEEEKKKMQLAFVFIGTKDNTVNFLGKELISYYNSIIIILTVYIKEWYIYNFMYLRSIAILFYYQFISFRKLPLLFVQLTLVKNNVREHEHVNLIGQSVHFEIIFKQEVHEFKMFDQSV